MPKSPSPEERSRSSLQRPKTANAEQARPGAAQHPLLDLQRTLGNAQVARMLAQRAAMPEEEEEQPGVVQAMPEVGLAGGPVSDGLASRINASRGSGAPLSDGLRNNMEQQFDTSFEDVRVHSGAESHQLNRSISAQAFTTGSDIFLGQGASAADSSLMAHELTHVVQQRSMPTSGPMTVGPADDGYERQAEATAAQVSSAAAQRKPEES